MANSARSRSLWARISTIDGGIAPSSRRVFTRTARPWARGTTTSTLRAAKRNPIPKYMIDSIMNAAFHALGAAQARPILELHLNRPARPGQPATSSEVDGVYQSDQRLPNSHHAAPRQR